MMQLLDVPVGEHAVRWHEVDGSKLIRTKWDVITTSLRMARDMLAIRLMYTMSLWRVDKSKRLHPSL